MPARFIRTLSDDEQDALKGEADDVRRLAWQHAAEELPHGTAWRGVEAYRAALVDAGRAADVPLRRLKYDARKQAEAAATNALAAQSGGPAHIK